MKRQDVRRTLIFTSFFLLPITLNYFSPALLIQGTLEKTVVAGMVVWSLYFLTAIIVGRAGCSYFCPLGGLQMLKDKVATKKLKHIPYLGAVKYVLWGLWMGTVAYMAIKVGGYDRVNLLYMTPTGISVDSLATLIVYFSMTGLVLLPLLLGKYAFCRYFCFFSPFNIIGSKIGRFLSERLGLPHLRLEASPEKCNACGRCDRECPMSLEVAPMVAGDSMKNTECVMCGNCVDSCKRDAISYAFRRATSPKDSSRKTSLANRPSRRNALRRNLIQEDLIHGNHDTGRDLVHRRQKIG